MNTDSTLAQMLQIEADRIIDEREHSAKCQIAYDPAKNEFCVLVQTFKGFGSAWFPIKQDVTMNFYSEAYLKPACLAALAAINSNCDERRTA